MMLMIVKTHHHSLVKKVHIQMLGLEDNRLGSKLYGVGDTQRRLTVRPQPGQCSIFPSLFKDPAS